MNKICIVILNYNNYKDTIECVQSLQRIIDSSKHDIVVVDNASTNDSVVQLKKVLSHLQIIESPDNRGYAHGNNIGIKYAKAKGYDYICVLNNDTVVEIDFLELCIQNLERNLNIAFISPTLVEYKDKNLVQSTGGDIFINKGLVTLKNHGANRDELPLVIESDYIGGACMVFKTSLLDEVGYIPESYFLFFEETEWCYKAKKLGYKNICLTDSYIYHKGSVSIKSISGLQEYLMERNRVVFVRRNSGNMFVYFQFLSYLFIRQIYRILTGKEKRGLVKIKSYFDGIFNIVDAKYPFVKITK